jgi:hypothetical protein
MALIGVEKVLINTTEWNRYGCPPRSAMLGFRNNCNRLSVAMNWLNWKILLKVLPWSALFCLLKVLIHYLQFEPWSFDSLTGSLLGATTFALTIVLGGTLSDYRGSEGMPLQIINALETIHDNAIVVGKIRPYDAKTLDQPLANVAIAITDWLESDKSFEQSVETSLSQLNQSLVPLGQVEQGLLVIHRMQTEIARIRLVVNQMRSLRDSDFVPAAYTLLLLFTITSSITLLLIRSISFSEGATTSTFLFTLLIYLFVFIRDLDNPFEYQDKSGVDIDLSCLHQFSQRYQASADNR